MIIHRCKPQLHSTLTPVQAFCPVVTMLLLFAARLEAPSGRLCGAVGLIAAGVALASYGELNLSLVRAVGRGCEGIGVWHACSPQRLPPCPL